MVLIAECMKSAGYIHYILGTHYPYLRLSLTFEDRVTSDTSVSRMVVWGVGCSLKLTKYLIV